MCISNEGSPPGKCYLSLRVLTAEEIPTFTAPVHSTLVKRGGGFDFSPFLVILITLQPPSSNQPPVEACSSLRGSLL